MSFTANFGGADRMIRIILGLALFGLTLTGTIGLWGSVGVLLVVSAFLRFCPAYAICGVRSCAAR